MKIHPLFQIQNFTSLIYMPMNLIEIMWNETDFFLEDAIINNLSLPGKQKKKGEI